ncbi:hypothetical protein ACNRBS_04365 [Ralstonia pseudosolanacearum]|uniref:hypothetical protein n=1 Tax=Ralstonia pseudosolanacearum TaxID=1310165 RepID=UPI0018A401D8|nr:hypothetical protein MAFF211491_38130 [Ralstonia solanacearum]BCM14838.1 hypothetical protein MAFF241648_40280 [Ralstonia solanacearum]BCN11942.1 hypothetical protein RPSD_38270 [Ralstonia solanacearum]
MARRDYSDDEDFYSQGFERKGVVSVWLGLKDRGEESDVDTLQDLCGVGYYRLSDQESNSFNYELTDLSNLLSDLSYSSSYADEVMAAAQEKAINKARRIIVQYDFAYDPAIVTREIDEDPIFLGVFFYSVK